MPWQAQSRIHCPGDPELGRDHRRLGEVRTADGERLDQHLHHRGLGDGAPDCVFAEREATRRDDRV